MQVSLKFLRYTTSSVAAVMARVNALLSSLRERNSSRITLAIPTA